MTFDARQFLTFFGIEGIKQARKGNLMAHCPNFEGLHPNGDKKRSFGILEEPKWEHGKGWIPAGTSNCYVCGGMSLESLTAKLLSDRTGRVVNELEALTWLEDRDWLPEDTSEMEPQGLVNFLSGLGYDDDMEILETYDDSVLDEYLKALHPMALQRGEQKNAISVKTARDKFRLGYCERSKRTVIPVYTSSQRLAGVISRATRQDDFIRYGVGVPDESYPNPGWKMKLDFLKSQVVYGEHTWNRFERSTFLLVESPLDVIYAHECGLHEQMDIGAIMGAKASKEHLTKICDYPYVIVALDNDNAGNENLPKLVEELFARGCEEVYYFDNYGKKDLWECTKEEILNLPSRLRKVDPTQFGGK